MSEDNWKHRSSNMKCGTCMYFVAKEVLARTVGIAYSLTDVVKKKKPPEQPKLVLGRCRRNAPTMKGWPALFDNDWCGDHKLDENKI